MPICPQLAEIALTAAFDSRKSLAQESSDARTIAPSGKVSQADVLLPIHKGYAE
jgi:hypothetical protein